MLTACMACPDEQTAGRGARTMSGLFEDCVRSVAGESPIPSLRRDDRDFANPQRASPAPKGTYKLSLTATADGGGAASTISARLR